MFSLCNTRPRLDNLTLEQIFLPNYDKVTAQIKENFDLIEPSVSSAIHAESCIKFRKSQLKDFENQFNQ